MKRELEARRPEVVMRSRASRTTPLAGIEPARLTDPMPLPAEALDDRIAIVGTAGPGTTYAATGCIQRRTYSAARRQRDGLWAPQRPIKGWAGLLGHIEEIVRRGRVRGFIPWLITQRPAVVHKDVLSQADILIAMKLTASQDRDAIGAWIEGQADRQEGKRILGDLPRLLRGEGYLWAPAHDILHRVAFPPIRTFDSSRTPKRGERLAIPRTLAEVDLTAIVTALAAARSEERRVGREC